MTDLYCGPPDSKYYWRHVRCRWCGARYRDFRAPSQPGFKEVRRQAGSERDTRIEEENDYSQPPRRARVLGIMHQHKVEWWLYVHSRCRENMMEDKRVWIDELEEMKGQDVVITTKLGTTREGHLSGIKTSEVAIAGKTFNVPTELILNHEEMDAISFGEVASIEIE